MSNFTTKTVNHGVQFGTTLGPTGQDTCAYFNGSSWLELDFYPSWESFTVELWINLPNVENLNCNPRLVANGHGFGLEINLNNYLYSFNYAVQTNFNNINVGQDWNLLGMSTNAGYGNATATVTSEAVTVTNTLLSTPQVTYSGTIPFSSTPTIADLKTQLNATVPGLYLVDSTYENTPSVNLAPAATFNVSPYVPGGAYTTWLGGRIMSPNTWYHLVFTWDQLSMVTYTNGNVSYYAQQPSNSGYTFNGNLVQSAYPIYVGRGVTYNGDYLVGSLAELAFYKYTLSWSQVVDHYNTMIASPVDYPGLVLRQQPEYYHRLNDPSGSISVANNILYSQVPLR